MMLVNSSFLNRAHVYNARANVYKTRDIAFRRVSMIRVFCVFSQVAVTPRAEIPWRGLEPGGSASSSWRSTSLISSSYGSSKGEYKNCLSSRTFWCESVCGTLPPELAAAQTGDGRMKATYARRSV